MFKSFAHLCAGNVSLRVCAAMLLSLLCATTAHAKGKGPVGIWPASERYALVADTSLPGLVLVDLETGAAVERLMMHKARPVGVSSCPACKFALIVGGRSNSGAKANVWRLHFSDTVAHLLATKGKLGLSEARLETLNLRPEGKTLEDGRMGLVSDDGKTAFIASSDDHAVLRVDLTDTPTSKFLLHHPKVEPFGLNWDRDGNLLLAMHKRQVWRMNRDGGVLAVYDTRKALCPGATEFNPNLRAAVDDPVNANSILVLASNPISYDAVVWRLSVDAQGQSSCESVAAKIGFDSGWIDDSGEAIEFSRPHFFDLRPDHSPPQLILTDIDNRALRLLDLTTYASTTVMYDRDRIHETLPPEVRLSKASCTALNWPVLVSATGTAICVKPTTSEANDMNLAQASSYCRAAGARLCEPAELLWTDQAPEGQAWTAAECASCWQRSERERCVIAAEDYRTPDSVHSHKEFAHSWRSGHALVRVQAGDRHTICRPLDDKLKAAAPCCADERGPDA